MILPRFSIVVPVYNAEKYLDECVNSVLSQSATDFELILVNDGSTDNSGTLCDGFALRDKRVKVIHQQNSGHIVARLTGVNHANGEYVLFMDSDDYWLDGCLEIIEKNLVRFGSDVLIFRLKRGKEICHDFFGGEKERITHGEYFTVSLAESGMNSLVIKAFSKRLFENIDISGFTHLRNSEDLVLSTILIKAADSISYIPDVLYYYRPNELSITNNLNKKAIEEFLISRNVLWKELEQHGLDNQINKKVLYTELLRRVADYAFQVSMSKLSEEEKRLCFDDVCNLDMFNKAMSESDLSVFGAAKQLRLKLLRSKSYTVLMLLDKIRARVK